jgi:hypothetical protein
VGYPILGLINLLLVVYFFFGTIAIASIFTKMSSLNKPLTSTAVLAVDSPH